MLLISEILKAETLSNLRYFLKIINSTTTALISKIITVSQYKSRFCSKSTQFVVKTTNGFVIIFARIITLKSSHFLIQIITETNNSIIKVKTNDVTRLSKNSSTILFFYKFKIIMNSNI